MSRVMIDDRWLKDGTPGRVKRSVGQARDPMAAKVPKHWKTTLYGHGMRWRCRWYQPDNHGRHLQRSRSFKSLREAEEFASAMEDDARRGRYHDPRDAQRPFSEAASAWLSSKVDLKASTRGRYRLELDQYVLPRWGAEPVGTITTAGLQDWVRGLQAGDYPVPATRHHAVRPLSARSIRSIVMIVTGGVLSYAAQNG